VESHSLGQLAVNPLRPSGFYQKGRHLGMERKALSCRPSEEAAESERQKRNNRCMTKMLWLR
jgi:hypothetical protein